MRLAAAVALFRHGCKGRAADIRVGSASRLFLEAGTVSLGVDPA